MGVPYAEVIGDPIAHSKSPLIHNFWLKRLGIQGEYRAECVKTDALHEYLFARRGDPQWRGCNVTMPHKAAVLPFLAYLADSAEKSRAANVVIPAGGRTLKGHNTDVAAIAELLGKLPRFKYSNYVATYVQVIGAGGAARAAAIGAGAAGYGDFDFFNRSLAGAQAMASWFGLDPDAYACTIDGLGPIRNPDDGSNDQRYSHIIINATSLGMLGNGELEADLSRYYPDTVVVDLPYKPGGTRLVKAARELGLRTIDGLQVLVAQAAHAFQLFFGQAPPRQHDEELRELVTR
jgi:shikimate dehydrogenase